MKNFALLAAFGLVLAAPAHAKDVAVILSDAEQQALVRALDANVRANGLSVAADMLHLLNRVQTAPAVTETKTEQPPPPAAKE